MIHNLYKKHDREMPVVAGFSLIEVMLALFVLVTGVLTTITLTVNSITQTQDSRDSLIAAVFAQEGIELARSVRDENATRAFYDQSVQPFRYFVEGVPCSLDQKSTHAMRGSVSGPLRCGSSARFNLVLDTSNDRYNSSLSNSSFKRSLYFTNFVENDGEPAFVDHKSVDVISTVTWGGAPLPGPLERCDLTTSCVRNESTLTTWILH